MSPHAEFLLARLLGLGAPAEKVVELMTRDDPGGGWTPERVRAVVTRSGSRPGLYVVKGA